LDYNLIVIGGPSTENFAPLAARQFERTIAADALAPLSDTPTQAIHRAYALLNRVNTTLGKWPQWIGEEVAEASLGDSI
jgi:hypothetical protein